MKTIVVHCSATKDGVYVDASDIDRWHKRRGWQGIGYHYVVKLDGTIEKGRDVEKQGAHVAGHNVGTIGICYIGGLDKDGKPKDTRLDCQKESLQELIDALRLVFDINRVVGHRDLSPDRNGDGVITKDEWLKECPCFNAIDEYN